MALLSIHPDANGAERNREDAWVQHFQYQVLLFVCVTMAHLFYLFISQKHHDLVISPPSQYLFQVFLPQK